jgi:hypothetical protein
VTQQGRRDSDSSWRTNLLLLSHHLRDCLGVVGHVGIHYDHEVALGKLQAVHVGCTQTELAGAEGWNNAVLAV